MSQRSAPYLEHHNMIRAHDGIGGISPAEYLGVVIKTKTGTPAEKTKTALRYVDVYCQ